MLLTTTLMLLLPLLVDVSSVVVSAMSIKPALLPQYVRCQESNGPFCKRGSVGDGVVEYAFKTRENEDTRIWLPIDTSTNTIVNNNKTLPIVLWIHPMYDKTLPVWIAHNRRNIDHLVSHGFAVVATYRVTPMGLRPTFEAAYAPQLFWNIGDHTLEALQLLVRSKAASNNGNRIPSDIKPFVRYIDPSRAGVTGYSVGAALSVRLVDRAAEASWDGLSKLRTSSVKQPVLGAVSLGPTIGLPRNRGGSGARDALLRVKNRTAPLLLIAGTSDRRNALKDVNTLYDESPNSQLRVRMLLQSGTHCFLNVRGGECR